MSKALSAKSSGLDFSDLDKPEAAESSPTPVPVRARSGVAAVERSVGVHQKLQEAQDRLKQFEDARLVEKLDPNQLKPSRWKNRDEAAFATPEFAELKEEIRLAGGNVQAIKVRKRAEGEFEIVYGHRRTRACLELGLMVSAVVDDLSDAAAFVEMHRENRSRADLSPWEQGVMFQDALAKGLFPSMRKLAEALGVSSGNMTNAMKLAELPIEVVAAFSSPLDLQFRWALPLQEAVEKDREGVLTRAVALRDAGQKRAPRHVFEVLTGRDDGGAQAATKQIRFGRRVAGTFSRDAKNGVVLKLAPDVLSLGQEKLLLEYLQTLFGKKN
jgi:ParB family chromosome partitioning protein